MWFCVNVLCIKLSIHVVKGKYINNVFLIDLFCDVFMHNCWRQEWLGLVFPQWHRRVVPVTSHPTVSNDVIIFDKEKERRNKTDW